MIATGCKVNLHEERECKACRFTTTWYVEVITVERRHIFEQHEFDRLIFPAVVRHKTLSTRKNKHASYMYDSAATITTSENRTSYNHKQTQESVKHMVRLLNT